MVKTRELCMEEKSKIIKLHEKGLNPSQIAQKTQFKRSTFVDIIKKWSTTRTLANCQRLGRPRVTKTRQDRKLIQLATTDRRLTLSKLAKSVENDFNLVASPKTIKRRLHEANLKGRRARKKPLLSKKNIAKRLKWARDHEAWTNNDWNKILWSDESKFCIFGNNGSKFVWRRPGEALKNECLQPTVKHGGGKNLSVFTHCTTL